MASSVKANLLDDGVVDTLGSVGATSGVHTSVSINVSDSAQIPRAALREACQQTCVTHDDGKSTQHKWAIQNLQNVVKRTVILSKSPSVSSQTDTMVLWTSRMQWRILVRWSAAGKRTNIGSFR
jgi:hypothetical protein